MQAAQKVILRRDANGERANNGYVGYLMYQAEDGTPDPDPGATLGK
jgi:hypothetical protein